MTHQYVVYFQNGLKRHEVVEAASKIDQLGAHAYDVKQFLGAAFINATDEQVLQIKKLESVHKISPVSFR